METDYLNEDQCIWMDMCIQDAIERLGVGTDGLRNCQQLIHSHEKTLRQIRFDKEKE